MKRLSFLSLFLFPFILLHAQFENNPLARKGIKSVSTYVCGYGEKDSTGLKLINYTAYDAKGNPLFVREIKMSGVWEELSFNENNPSFFYDVYQYQEKNHGYDTIKFIYDAKGLLIKKDMGLDEDGKHCFVSYNYQNGKCREEIMKCSDETYTIDEYTYDSLGRKTVILSALGIEPYEMQKFVYNTDGKISKTISEFKSGENPYSYAATDSVLHFYGNGFHTVITTQHKDRIREIYDYNDSLLSKTTLLSWPDTVRNRHPLMSASKFSVSRNSSGIQFYLVSDTLSFSRNAQGKPLKAFHGKYDLIHDEWNNIYTDFDPAGNMLRQKWTMEYVTDSLRKEPRFSELWQYNSKDFPAKHFYYDAMGNLFREADYYYNSKNDLAEERIYNGEHKILQRKKIITKYY